MKRLLSAALLTLGPLLFGPAGVEAQTETGRITGTVTDTQGAVVPGVTVTATSVATKVARTTVTDASGKYVIANVLPAAYELTFQLSGFKTAATKVQVTVGSEIAVDAVLEVGGVAETVSVVGQTEAVNTRTAEIVSTVTETQIRELPTITRDPYDLIAIAGNVNDQDPTIYGGDTARGVHGFSINGLRSTATNAMLDGSANNDEFTGSVGQSIPLDAVQEFSIISSNFSAQYGRATAGIVNVATKSGSNQFHGTGYEFFRNEKLATQTVNEKERDIEEGAFSRHQPGFSLGGPILRDRAHFFVSGEFIRVRSDATDIAWVPTPDFLARTSAATRAYFNAFPLGTPINGPVISRGEIQSNPGGPFAALPANLPVFGQVIRKIPTDAGGGVPQNTQQWVARVDWTMGPNSSAYVRYAAELEDFLIGSNANSPFQGFDAGETNKNHNALLSLTHVWSSQLTSQSKIVFNRLHNDQPLGEQPPGPGLYLRTSASRILGVPVALPGYLPYTPGSAIPFGGPQNLVQLYHDQTWLKGAHDLRFGGSFVRIMDNRTFGAYQNSVMTLGSTIPNALDNLVRGELLTFEGAVDPQGRFPGQAITLPARSPSFTRNNRYNEYALYFNDAWAIRSTVTLNAGVRYEYYGVQQNKDPNLDSNFYYGPGDSIPARIRTGSVQLAPNSPVGGLWKPDRNNFAPRLGVAWDVFGDGRTSLRGGYGMAYERNFGNVTFNVIQNPPNYAVVRLTAGADVATIPITTDVAGPLAGTGTKVLPPTSLRHVDENIVNAYAHFWSAAFQHQLGGRTTAAIEYTGSRGVDLYTINRQNIPGSGAAYLGDANPRAVENAQYSAVNTRANGGRSQYHGVTFSVENRGLTDLGLAFTGRYTVSDTKDNLSSTFSESTNNSNLGLLDPYNPDLDYGPADYDVRHRVALSAIWELPFGRNSSGVIRQLASGWQVNAIFTAQTGAPFTIYDCTNSNFLCPRLLQVGSLPSPSSNPLSTGDPNTYEYLDLSSQVSAAGSYANAATGLSDFGPFPANMTGRNIFRRPGKWNADAAFGKRFRLPGGQAILARLEVYNLFAHANLYVDGTQNDISATTMVTAFRGDTGEFDGAPPGDGQRRIQLGFKFEF